MHNCNVIILFSYLQYWSANETFFEIKDDKKKPCDGVFIKRKDEEEAKTDLIRLTDYDMIEITWKYKTFSLNSMSESQL